MRSRLLLAAALSAGLVALTGPPSLAASDATPGMQSLIQAHYYESRGDLPRAKAILLDLLRSNVSERANRQALGKLVDLARRSGNLREEIDFLEIAARGGSQDAFSALARIASEHGVTPPTLETMGPSYEAAALALPSTSLANFMAELAEKGLAKRYGIRETDPGFWYLVAAQRGSRSGLVKLIERSVAAGRDDEAVALLKHLPAEDQAQKQLSIAKDLARGDGMKQDRKRSARWFALAPKAEAHDAYGGLVRAAISDGDADGALFWLGKLGSVAAVGSASALGKLYDIAAEKDRKAILASLTAAARKGDAEAAQVAVKILTADGGKPSGEVVALLLAAGRAGDPAAIGQLTRLIAALPPDDPATIETMEALSTAAASGSVAAMAALARFYSTGGPVEMDAAASLDWYRKAAEAGDPEAQFRVGLLIAATDPETSQTLLKRAAAGGYGPARSALAAAATVTN